MKILQNPLNQTVTIYEPATVDTDTNDTLTWTKTEVSSFVTTKQYVGTSGIREVLHSRTVVYMLTVPSKNALIYVGTTTETNPQELSTNCYAINYVRHLINQVGVLEGYEVVLE